MAGSDSKGKVVITEIEVVDLPKGHYEWHHKPLRPTEYTVRRKGQSLSTRLRYTLQEPLILSVGDTVCFEGSESVPPDIWELTKRNSGHPVYAVITVKPKEHVDGKTASSSTFSAGPNYVG